MELLSVSDLHVHSATGPVLHGISLSVQPLQNIAIAGATGSGKSTLLKAIAGLVQPLSGRVILEGKKVLGPDEKLLPGHPHIAYLSQHFELRNNYRVEEELECVNQMSEAEAARIYAICEVDHLLNRRTDQLSGGEKQRIVTARLLTTKPKLFLLDEPFSNLDPAHKQAMQRVIGDISSQLGITCMLVTHDPQDSLPWAHRMMILEEGRIIQDGNPQLVYKYPVNTYAAGLLGRYNLLTSQQAGAFGLAKDAAYIMRPEDFYLEANSSDGVAGTIEQVKYYGSHYEAAIRVLDGSLCVRMAHDGMEPGRQVYLHYRP